MPPDLFRGPNLPRLLTEVRNALGDDAIILATRAPALTDGVNYEIDATTGEFTPAVPSRGERPTVIALVGPPGGGKTTTAVKLALHPDAFGARRVGLLTLDTYRAAAVEQLEAFAGIAELPLEVAFDAADAARALDRLSDCDVILVDTPGRGVRGITQLDWHASLTAVHAEEVHLVLPATVRGEVALATREAHRRCGITHTLLTMLDEVPARASVAELCALLAMPVRWTTAGPTVPDDLSPVGLGRFQQARLMGVA
jgi:flagellar biosynthesis protein FlhF